MVDRTFAQSTSAADLVALVKQDLGQNAAWYQSATAEQVAIVTAALQDLAELGLEALTHPGKADAIAAEVALVRSTLTSEAALAAVNAETAVVTTLHQMMSQAMSAFSAAVMRGIAVAA